MAETSVTTATKQAACECGRLLADSDVTPRHGSPYGTVYASALCECGLFHYVEVADGRDDDKAE